MSATRGDLGAVQSGASRRGREKRRGRNEAAEVRLRMVDALSLEHWRGEEPQERKSANGRPAFGAAARQDGRKAWNSEGEM
jgi:hypothetical protein